ncbi:hypothetical protein AVEN_55835-1 [Araneus ventricosus]|uniref:Inner centromere protein ARK-binding domain-containing protein n=1 Tax=Araneus ventricosus TaxID=182803 RepID=A0A4Y2CMU9_ARAVE|nr:hypothetical protein AVEN_55835-1 [Araneus ventricosus]
MSYLRGASQSGPRLSTVLTEMGRLHLHKKKGKDSIQVRKSRKSSIKTPLPRKSNVKFSVHAENNTSTVIKKTGNVNSSTFHSIERKEATLQPLATPVVNRKGTTLKMKDRSSKKRKSSSELSLENVKKPKQKMIDPEKEREKSMQNPRVEKKQMKAKNSSLLQSSVGATNGVSVLKENRTNKAFENRKNIMALRKQKLEENKKTREEKLEKSLPQGRMKLEEQKGLSKLRSGGLEKAMTTPKKKALLKIVAENETSKKNSVKSDKEKQTSVKKLKIGNLKKTGLLKSNEKTPKKNQKHETMLNTTYVATGKKAEEPSKTSSKGKTLTELNKSTPAQKKGHESYAITPARSSFVSYDISEIRSDSEEEEQETNSKPIPAWATGVRLRNALLQQHHHPIDTDELFGNVVDLPDLAVIMGVSKKQYGKRTSSAVWNSSFSFS